MKKSSETKATNALCLKCLRNCKQPVCNLLVECPRYYPMPFKVELYRYDQLDLFDCDEKDNNQPS
jgi:hypothetical protein